jgi:carboxylesterase
VSVAGQGDPTPFEEWNGQVGCLLLHGFPGSPGELRGLGAYLSERGVSVRAPLLRGHGRQPEALRGVRWLDWVRDAAAGLRRLQARHDHVFVAGLSMGGALALYLAAELPLSGIALLSPAVRLRNRMARFLPLAAFFVQWVELGEDADLIDPTASQRHWYYTRAPAAAVAEMYLLIRAAWRAAPGVDAPALIVQSPRDAVLNPEGAEALLGRLGSSDKRLVWVERSGHNLLVDVERERVFAEVHALIERVLADD